MLLSSAQTAGMPWLVWEEVYCGIGNSLHVGRREKVYFKFGMNELILQLVMSEIVLSYSFRDFNWKDYGRNWVLFIKIMVSWTGNVYRSSLWLLCLYICTCAPYRANIMFYLLLTHWSLNKEFDILKTYCQNRVSWEKIIYLWITYSLDVFLVFLFVVNYSCQRLGSEKATYHY